jgi:hypothetical protein
MDGSRNSLADTAWASSSDMEASWFKEGLVDWAGGVASRKMEAVRPDIQEICNVVDRLTE